MAPPSNPDNHTTHANLTLKDGHLCVGWGDFETNHFLTVLSLCQFNWRNGFNMFSDISVGIAGLVALMILLNITEPKVFEVKKGV